MEENRQASRLIELLAYFYELSHGVFTGMTLKAAGNFRPSPSFSLREDFELAGKALSLIQSSAANATLPRIMVMRAEHHTGRVINRPRIQKGAQRDQIKCDGAIIHGPGAIVAFPGGCPMFSFHDRQVQLNGMLHAGWRSVANGIIYNFLKQWTACGGRPPSTEVKALPAICGHCLTYKPANFKYDIAAKMKTIPRFEIFIQTSENYTYFFLADLVVWLLEGQKYYVNREAECTCHSGKYWCYRCDDQKGEIHRNAAFLLATS